MEHKRQQCLHLLWPVHSFLSADRNADVRVWPEQPSEVMGESGDAVLIRLSNKIKGAPVSNIMEGQTNPELL